jgi:ssDNA-binding Zn-finger/Zn-ribbon topoisomerase 1
MDTHEAAKNQLKRLPQGIVPLMLVGDLIMAQSPGLEYAGLFKRYEELFASFANLPKDERILVYKFFAALVLTSFAKKTSDNQEKKSLYNQKNAIFIDIVKNPEYRKKVTFAYLSSKNFRVLEYCPECQKSNSQLNLEKKKWKFCKRCKVDREFYNVLSMRHKWQDGEISIFLSNDLIDQLPINRLKLRKSSLGEAKEGGQFRNFQYNAKNLDIFTKDSISKFVAKITAG